MRARIVEFTDREALALLRAIRHAPELLKRNKALRRAENKLNMAFGPEFDYTRLFPANPDNHE